MSGSGGVFTTPVSLPVEDTGEVSFAANITAGGQTSASVILNFMHMQEYFCIFMHIFAYFMYIN